MNVPKLRFKEFDGEWEYHKFSDEIKLLGGATPLKSNKAYWNGDIVWLSSQEIKAKYVEEGTYKITQKAIDDNTTKMVKAGTPLIVSRSGILARMFPISMPTVDVAINQDIKALIFDKEQLDTDFLVGQLQAKECFILKSIVKTGTTVQSVNIPDLEKMKLSIPSSFKEQKKIGLFFKMIDEKIQLQQQKIDLLQEQKKGFLQNIFPKNEEKQPRYRFKGFYEEWKEVALGELFEKVNERNDGSFNENHWISVAKMYFQNPEKVQSNNIDTRTYVMREGDIAFEGHPNKDFKFGRFVANDIGPGVVSELFPIYRHKIEYDNNYWKNFIQLENIMAPIFAKSITSSGNSSNKLDNKHFLKQKIRVATLEEQKVIGMFLRSLDEKISVQKKYLELLQQQKQGLMQQMFI